MSECATPEQAMLRDQVARYVRTSGAFERRKLVLDAGGDAANWSAFAGNGWLGAGFSEENGGFGGGPAEMAIVVGELGRGLMLEPVGANLIGGAIVARFGAAAQKAALLSPMINGELGLSPAFSEASGDHDWGCCGARLASGASGYRLNGRKIVAPAFAPGVAGLRLLALARADDDDLVIAVVDSRADGVDMDEYALIDGVRGCDVAFSDVALTDGDIIRPGPEGLAAIMDLAAFVTCAEMVGVMNAAFELTLDYVRQRKQFGATLGSNQALQHRLVDMMMALRDAEALVSVAGALLGEEGADADAVSAAVHAARIQCAEAGRLISREAVQMHGGVGTTHEAAVSHYFKRLIRLQRLYGDAAFHRERLATLMERADRAAA